MPRRGEMELEFGRASFDKEFGTTNVCSSRGLGPQVLFKYYGSSITISLQIVNGKSDSLCWTYRFKIELSFTVLRRARMIHVGW